MGHTHMVRLFSDLSKWVIYKCIFCINKLQLVLYESPGTLSIIVFVFRLSNWPLLVYFIISKFKISRILRNCWLDKKYYMYKLSAKFVAVITWKAIFHISVTSKSLFQPRIHWIEWCFSIWGLFKILSIGNTYNFFRNRNNYLQ